MSQHRSPLFALLLMSALAQHARDTQTQAERPVERKPLSRKLECPDCGQEVVLIRSVHDGKPCLDLHFLMDDGEHMVAGMLFASAEERDEHFNRYTYEDTKAVFSDMLAASSGLPAGLTDLLGALGRTR